MPRWSPYTPPASCCCPYGDPSCNRMTHNISTLGYSSYGTSPRGRVKVLLSGYTREQSTLASFCIPSRSLLINYILATEGTYLHKIDQQHNYTGRVKDLQSKGYIHYENYNYTNTITHINTHAARKAAQMNSNQMTSYIVWANGRRPQENIEILIKINKLYCL